jgi:3-phenylpropionate/trans-cinnamate dioxygenase ferredoxin component
VSATFLKVANLSDLADGGRLSLELDGRAVLLFRIGDDVYAVEDVCTHDGQPLTDGAFVNGEIECPRHGARFDVKTGRAMCMPAVEPVRVYPVRISQGDIEVELASED